MTVAIDAIHVSQALHNRIVSDFGVQSVLGTPVRAYEHVPKHVIYPYLSYGTLRSEDDGGDATQLVRHTITLHVWSRYEGRQEVLDILHAISVALEKAPLSLAQGHAVITAIPYADILRATDGFTRHGLLRLQIYTQSEEIAA